MIEAQRKRSHAAWRGLRHQRQDAAGIQSAAQVAAHGNFGAQASSYGILERRAKLLGVLFIAPSSRQNLPLADNRNPSTGESSRRPLARSRNAPVESAKHRKT